MEEETTWLEAQKLMPEEINLYYRRRAKNTARKSGNIEDFCTKWGAAYESMIVLDADSLMNGSNYAAHGSADGGQSRRRDYSSAADDRQ